MRNAVPHCTTSPFFEKYFFEGVLAVFLTHIFSQLQQFLLAPDQVVDHQVFAWNWPDWADKQLWPFRKIHSPNFYDENSQFAKSWNFLRIWLHLTLEYKVTFSPIIWGGKLVCDNFPWMPRIISLQNNFCFDKAPFICGALFEWSWTMRFHYTENKAIFPTFQT